MNRRKSIIQTVTDAIGMGKVPPQATEMEEMILGALMIERDAITKVNEILKDDSFYKESHRLIFLTIKELYAEANPVDMATVAERLKKKEQLDLIGGAYYITQLVNRVASAAHIEYHSMIVEQKAIQRRLITLCNETIKECYEDSCDAFEAYNSHESALGEVGATGMRSTQTDVLSRTKEAMKAIYEGLKHSGITGIPSGIMSLDKFTGGFQRGDLIVIGGRPGHSKTALILSMAHKTAALGFAPLIFQQEMGRLQTSTREIAMYTGINMEDIRRCNLNEYQLQHIETSINDLLKRNVFIDHSSNLTISNIKSIIKKHKGCDIAFIDYLQLMHLESKGENSNEESMIAITTRKLKQIAKELNIPVVLLSQLNREVEKRNDKKPRMSDLKGSGAIEADADIVIVCFNPSKYSQNPVDENGKDLRGMLELIFEKNRMGRTGSKWLKIDEAINTFGEVEELTF